MNKDFRESLKRIRTNRFTKEKWNDANSWKSESINSLKKTQTEVKLESKVLKHKEKCQGQTWPTVQEIIYKSSSLEHARRKLSTCRD